MAAQISNKEDVVGVVFFVCKGLVKGCLKSASIVCSLSSVASSGEFLFGQSWDDMTAD